MRWYYRTGKVAVLIQTVCHKDLWIVKQATRARVVFLVSNEKDAFGKISSDLNGYNISISQFKWERKGKNVFRSAVRY